MAAAENPAAALAAALGHPYEDPQWRVTSTPPVTPDRWGPDHATTFLYVETRVVDHKGLLSHDQMRCHPRRHPILANARRYGSDGSRYPTQLRWGAEAADHDDYDCLDDLVAAGLLTVTMPIADHEEGMFRDSQGRPVLDADGDPIRPGFYTGMDELRLGVYAQWGLTQRGWDVARAAREARAKGVPASEFTWDGLRPGAA